MYDIIKKQNGEAFAQGIRRFDSGLFDVENLDKMVRYAGRNPIPILGFLESFKGVEIEEVETDKSPFELLKMVGYDAFVADSLTKQNSIERYFADGEELCTFHDFERFEDYFIIHCVKEGADKLKREDFKGQEEREDEYGTSVISIQILKTGGYISIKNRYNHSVDSPDNTFYSNPDNIIKGLSSALKKYFKVDFASTKVAIPNGYTYQNGCIYRYYLEKNNAYYGDDFCLYNGKLYPINKDYQILIGPYLLDMKERRIFTDFPTAHFFDSMDEEKIAFLNQEFQNKKLHVGVTGDERIVFADNRAVVRLKEGQVIEFSLYECETFSSNVLKDFKRLKNLSSPSAKKVQLDVSGFYCLKKCSFKEAQKITVCANSPNASLKQIDAPKVRYFENLIPVFLPKLKDVNTPYMAERGLYTIAGLSIDTQKKRCLGVTNASDGFYELINDELASGEQVRVVMDNEDKKLFVDDVMILETKGSQIKKLHFKEASFIPNGALYGLRHVEEISAPRAFVMQEENICYCPNLKRVYLPNLTYVDNDCFNYNDSLEELYLDSVQEMGQNTISTNLHLRQVSLNSLKELSGKNIMNNQSLVSVNIKNVTSMGVFCMSWLKSLLKVDVPNLERMGTCCFQHLPKIRFLDAPKLSYIADRCFVDSGIQTLYAPCLQERMRTDYLPILTDSKAGPVLLSSQNNLFKFSQKAYERSDD